MAWQGEIFWELLFALFTSYSFGEKFIVIFFNHFIFLAMYILKQYPVPDNFFGDIPPLTDEEIEHYTNLARSWAKGLLDATTSDEVKDNNLKNLKGTTSLETN